MVTMDEVVAAIQDEPLGAYTEAAVERFDDQFWIVAASSTGKHHPEHENAEGGLVRHTVDCAVYTLAGIRRYGVPELRDIMLCAGLLHDGCKNGIPWRRYTAKDHPQIAAEQMLGSWLVGHEAIRDQIYIAAYAVQYHYGIWKHPTGVEPLAFRPDGDEDDKLSRHLAAAALILQEADYYSTRRFLGEPDENKLREALNGST